MHTLILPKSGRELGEWSAASGVSLYKISHELYHFISDEAVEVSAPTKGIPVDIFCCCRTAQRRLVMVRRNEREPHMLTISRNQKTPLPFLDRQMVTAKFMADGILANTHTIAPEYFAKKSYPAAMGAYLDTSSLSKPRVVVVNHLVIDNEISNALDVEAPFEFVPINTLTTVYAEPFKKVFVQLLYDTSAKGEEVK